MLVNYDSYYLIKCVHRDGTAWSPHTAFAWPLPHDGQPGAWVEGIPYRQVAPCFRGYHGCGQQQAATWFCYEWCAYQTRRNETTGEFEPIYVYDFYLMECRGRYRLDPNEPGKVAVGRARLLRKLPLTAQDRESLRDASCDAYTLRHHRPNTPAYRLARHAHLNALQETLRRVIGDEDWQRVLPR